MIKKIKNRNVYKLIAVIGLFVISSISYADDMDDVKALLDAYIETESDLSAQAQLMSADRIFIVGSPAMRMTDNATNMMGQSHVDKRNQQLDSKGIYYATREDQIVRVYGDAAVASFRRNLNWRPSAQGVRNGQSDSTNRQLVTVVMAKVDGDWKIVHTHISPA